MTGSGANGRAGKAGRAAAAIAAAWAAGLVSIASHAAPPLADASGHVAAASALDAVRASPEARMVAHWALETHDMRAQPFAVVDKKDARIYVFAAGGKLLGAAPVLLGAARGDDSAPGIGRRVAAGMSIPTQERTTPSGRFASQPGRNDKGEAIVWVDYRAAVAIHRLRPAPFYERRPQRLASETPGDNRISLGCVIVDGGFYDAVVAPTLGRERGVVYVLPETRSTETEFGIDASQLL